MERTILPVGLTLLCLAAVLGGCTKSEEKAPAAKATVAAPPAAASPAAMQAPAAADEPADELYVDLEGDPDEGAPPLTVTWTSEVEDGTPPYTYKWDFGDGTPPGSGANPTHVYQKAGEYTATLTVTDSKGITGSEEYDILVEEE